MFHVLATFSVSGCRWLSAVELILIGGGHERPLLIARGKPVPADRYTIRLRCLSVRVYCAANSCRRAATDLSSDWHTLLGSSNIFYESRSSGRFIRLRPAVAETPPGWRWALPLRSWRWRRLTWFSWPTILKVSHPPTLSNYDSCAEPRG